MRAYSWQHQGKIWQTKERPTVLEVKGVRLPGHTGRLPVDYVVRVPGNLVVKHRLILVNHGLVNRMDLLVLPRLKKPEKLKNLVSRKKLQPGKSVCLVETEKAVEQLDAVQAARQASPLDFAQLFHLHVRRSAEVP